MPFPAQNDISKKYSDYHKQIHRKRKRKIERKKQLFGFFLQLSLLLLCGLILQKVFFETYDRLFIRKFMNTEIQIPNDPSFLHSSEKYFANNYFLNTKVLGDTKDKNPIMKPMVLTKTMPGLTARLNNLAKNYSTIEPGIFIYDFNNGQYVNINAEKEFPTASIIKIPILFQMFRRTEMGLINLDDKMNITDYYLTGGSGMLQYRPIGTTMSVHNLARLMIQESDNTATNMILSNVGGVNDLNRVLRSWGFNKTHMSDLLPDLYGTNVSTPKDIGTMLFNIDNPDFLTLKSRAQIVNIMSHVRNRFLIQAGLPDSAQFIHKSGDIGTMLGDAGIVMLPDGRKYVIVIMVKRPWNSFSAKEFIVEASKITYNSISSRNY